MIIIETHKLFRDFEIQTNYQVSARQPDLVIVKKKKKKKKRKKKEKRTFAILVDRRVKLKECEKRGKFLDLVRKLEKQRNMKVTVVPILVGALGTIPKETGRLRNQRTSEEYPDYSITKIKQNTETRPGDLQSFKLPVKTICL